MTGHVTVYTLPDCPDCRCTRQFLDRSDIYHTIEPIPDTGPARDLITGLGHQQAPVVTVTGEDGELIEHWSGLRPDRILALTHTTH